METNTEKVKQTGEGSEKRRSSKLAKELPAEGLVRLNQILAVLPIGKTTFYDLIKQGLIPKPTFPFGSRIALWDVKNIRAFWKEQDNTGDSN